VLKITVGNKVDIIEFGYSNCSLDPYVVAIGSGNHCPSPVCVSENCFTQQTSDALSKTNLKLAAQQVDASRAQPRTTTAPPVIVPPIRGIKAYQLRDSFNEIHHGHRHEAIDIMAPAGTLVRAVVDGTIQKLFLSKAGGNTIYEFDTSGAYCYYYAHLERYADGLHEGMRVSCGEVIGYVGSTGDASPAAPHLHFAVYLLGSQRRWWKGVPIDPYPILERSLIASRPSAPIYLILEMLHAVG
jgi:murein DD-endopeptidase MepM/ murein hydrolase activator NlpD